MTPKHAHQDPLTRAYGGRGRFGHALAATVMGAVLALGALAGPALAQSDPRAERVASAFATDLAAAAQQGNRTALAAFLTERVDLARAFDLAFDPIDDLATEEQRRRLATLMTLTLADEARLTLEAARGGRFQIVGSRRVEAGTLVEGAFRDAAGDYPFVVLVGQADGRPLVLDMGSPRQSTVVTRLTYLTSTLAQASSDPASWIAAFEGAPGEQ